MLYLSSVTIIASLAALHSAHASPLLQARKAPGVNLGIWNGGYYAWASTTGPCGSSVAAYITSSSNSVCNINFQIPDYPDTYHFVNCGTSSFGIQSNNDGGLPCNPTSYDKQCGAYNMHQNYSCTKSNV